MDILFNMAFALDISKYTDIESFTSDPCNPLSCDECLAVVERTWRCSKCKEAKYCGKDCQRKAWLNGHKSYCCKITITHCPEMGFGVFALRDIAKGEVIVKEKPILNFKTQRELIAILQSLSDGEKRKVMSLHDYHDKKTFIGIIDTNCMKYSDNSHVLYHLMSRFNHSCVPNIRVDTDSTNPSVKPTPVVALKDIREGEELFWNYIVESSPYMTRSQRQEKLRTFYGIPCCQCQACSLTGDELIESDENRMKLKDIEDQLSTTYNAFIVPALAKRKRELFRKEGLDTANNLMRITRDLMLASINGNDFYQYKQEGLSYAKFLHDEQMIKYFSEYDVGMFH